MGDLPAVRTVRSMRWRTAVAIVRDHACAVRADSTAHRRGRRVRFS
jgi:hypothetical protein